MLFYVVDDEAFQRQLVKRVLEDAGHQVEAFERAEGALDAARKRVPDLLVTDLVMPGTDGLELCRMVRDDKTLDGLRVALLSSRRYEADRQRARDLGAAGYVLKGSDQAAMRDELEGIAANRVRLRFWGVRGTLPTPGPQSVRYGGNTSCLSMEAPDGRLLVFDAGTGIRELGVDLLRRGKRLSGHLLITHAHWDHINALPFFAPLFVQGNSFVLWSARHDDLGPRAVVEAQMAAPWFPVTISEFAAHLDFREVGEGTYDADGVEIRTMRLSHPGVCVGYRATWAGKTLCYVTDNELHPEGRPEHNPSYVRHLADFIRGADVLVTDTTYLDEEYDAHAGWGHSSVTPVAELAHAGGVREWCLYHHDPSHDDDDIDRKLQNARAALDKLGSKVVARAPAEGDLIEL